MRYPLSLVVCLWVTSAPTLVQATDFGAIGNGDWGNATTWTPAGGPPAATDNVFIGSSFPAGSANIATVTLTQDRAAAAVTVGRGVGDVGTLNLAGQMLTVEELLLGRFGGTATLNHGGGQFEAELTFVGGPSQLTLETQDTTQDLQLQQVATVSTTDATNVTRSVALQGTSQLNLGASLGLSLDLDLRGTGAVPSVLDANGQAIEARDIFIGRFGLPGSILNDGPIVANRDLEVSVGSFALDANDSVARSVNATFGGTVTLHANTAAQEARLSGGGSTLNTVATTNLSEGVLLNGAGETLNLGAALVLNNDLDIRGVGGVTSVVAANGHAITARDIFIGRFGLPGNIVNDGPIVANRDLEVSVGTFALDANDSVTRSVNVTSGGTLTLHASTAAQEALLSGGGSTLNTVATTNLSEGVLLNGAGETLNLGAALTLHSDLDIRGVGGVTSVVAANGHAITARDIFIGRFGLPGNIVDDGPIVANRDLEVSVGTFALDANDSVTRSVNVTSGGTLTLHANTAAQEALLSGGGSTLNTVATTNITEGVLLNGAGETLNLGAALTLNSDLDIRGVGGVTSVVAANGHAITARDIFIGRFGLPGNIIDDGPILANRDLEVSVGTFALDANDSVTRSVNVTSGGTLTLHANTAAQEALLSGGGSTLNTVATTNITEGVLLNGAGETLNLGAALTLNSDLDIRGVGGVTSVVNAQGQDVSARDLFLGRFGLPGDLSDSDLLTVARTMALDSSTVQINGGFDTVGMTLRLALGSTLSVDQAADGVRGLSLEGSVLEILDTSVLDLSFDNSLSEVGDWVFRWAGDRVSEINQLIGTGQIVVHSPHPFVVTNNGDGYTYIANFQGDFDGDDRLDCQDIDALTAAVASASMDLTFDLTGDGVVDIADRDAWLSGAGAAFLPSGNPYLLGDANLDGVVDGGDFIAWNQNKFTALPAWCGGDFNADGIVDGGDFILWNQHKFQAADGRLSFVPESGAGGMLIVGLVLLAGVRRTGF